MARQTFGRLRQLFRKILTKETTGSFPQEPYRYQTKEAGRVYQAILSGKLTHDSGKEIRALEREFANFQGCSYALATNSGTSALELAVQAMDLASGDEVIVPAYTFIATAQAVLTSGGRPVFADIDNSYTLSPQSVRMKLTKRTAAIIVVHMFGNVANMDEILTIARQHRLRVIEDCAQAVGARYRGQPVGSLGDVGCFSFNEKKAMPTGQGGMLVTNNTLYYRRALISRNTGIDPHDGQVKSIGHTFYLTEMQAILARAVLPQIPQLTKARVKNFDYLLSRWEKLMPFVRPYQVLSNTEPSFSRLVCQLNTASLLKKRDRVLKALRATGVPWKTFYPTPLYSYELFAKLHEQAARFNGKLPNVERLCRGQIGLEFSPYLGKENLEQILQSLTKTLL